MKKLALDKTEIIKNLSELKDLRDAIRHILKSQDLIEKADNDGRPRFAITDPKPKVDGPATNGLKQLGKKVNEDGLGMIDYMIGIPGHKSHYVASYDMNAPKSPWSVSLKQSDDGSTLTRSPNAHSSPQDAIADIANHNKLSKWKA